MKLIAFFTILSLMMLPCKSQSQNRMLENGFSLGETVEQECLGYRLIDDGDQEKKGSFQFIQLPDGGK